MPQRVKLFVVAKKQNETKKTRLHRSSCVSSTFTFYSIALLGRDPRPTLEIIRRLQTTPPPLLLRFVRLVCGEEGHTVGPEVGVEVSGLVETPATHLAAQVSVSILALRLWGGGSGRAVRRAVGTGCAAVCVALGVPHSVSDEAVPAERAGRCKADAALQALEGGGVAPMLGDVALKLGPVLCGEPAGDATENVIFFLCLTGRH